MNDSFVNALLPSKRGLSMSVRFQVAVRTSFYVNFIFAIVESGTKMFYLNIGLFVAMAIIQIRSNSGLLLF
ncbi:hypothetical protein VNO78_19383 [Psophocarpus tetragonolobus]|uniref:Uncharacterized protein n=1 Tax=Psophocarpus tetragonolobus TaxID=3891 RepID=A0AAN9SBX2_PSOTE